MCSELSRRDFVGAAATSVAYAWLGGRLALASPRRPQTPTSLPGASQPASAATVTADWAHLAELALQRVRQAGAEYGDIRILDTRRQNVIGRDGRIANIIDSRDLGFGVRVLFKGGWGFAASPILTPEEVQRVADLAAEIARASSAYTSQPVRLAPEPPHRDKVATPRRIDPFETPLESKTRLLLDAMDRMQSSQGVRRSSASIWTQRDVKLFASTEGSLIEFDLLASHGDIEATAVAEGRFGSRSLNTPYLRSGYEVIEEANLAGEAERVAREALEAVQAPAIEPGKYDLVLNPEHLSLTIHESCGHPSELDRALGYEANYAGTSHLTPDLLGKHRHGSRQVNLVADNTEAETLAGTGYDDDGVQAQRWDIVREGVFVGYSDNREVAPLIGLPRAHGSCRADSWSSVPIVRISNIGLQPGDGKLDDMLADVKRGIYIEGHGSFSIDQKRYNFQFGGDAFWMIENGRRTHRLRDVIYRGITPEFWGACDAVADASHRRKFGFINCGKGQPGQSGWMTHAASHARFRNIDVIRGETV